MNLFNLFRHPSALQDLSPKEIQNQIDENRDLVILDVRSAMEYRSGHIVGAKSYPLGQESAIAQAFARETPLVLICKTGHRSQAAASVLLKVGFHQISHLQGGMDRWRREQLPTEK